MLSSKRPSSTYKGRKGLFVRYVKDSSVCVQLEGDIKDERTLRKTSIERDDELSSSDESDIDFTSQEFEDLMDAVVEFQQQLEDLKKRLKAIQKRHKRRRGKKK